MKLAIVIPWFGSEQTGGAEKQAWQIAARLAARGHEVEVLTTRCRSFHGDWGVNDLSEDDVVEGRVLVRRFPVDQRQGAQFDELNARLLAVPGNNLVPGLSPLAAAQEAVFARENINSSKLLEYLAHSATEYHAFIFMPYLYGPIIHGLPLVADRAYLQPCLHDEVYAYLGCVENIFNAAKGVLYNSAGEAELAQRLYGPAVVHKGTVVGEGVETDSESINANQLPKPAEYRLADGKFLLYLGRRDPTKNTDLLSSAFRDFRGRHPKCGLTLVLAGPGAAFYGDTACGIVDLGLVDEKEKLALLTRCTALVQPSKNESYSRAMMEAWFAGKPVAVHADCLATGLAVQQARGGWTASTQAQWADLFHSIDNTPSEVLARMGAEGARYAREYADWDRVMERYEETLGRASEPHGIETPGAAQKTVHQLLPNLTSGDAISNHALHIRDYLRGHGFQSKIFVRYLGQSMATEANPFRSNSISSQDGLIYHHSIGSELTPIARAHAGAKLFIYHNITPPCFFSSYDSAFGELLSEGLVNLQSLSRDFPHAVGDSEFNASELARAGFAKPGVLPLTIDPAALGGHADRATLASLRSPAKKNVLFVGRLCPNKRQDDLIRMFGFLRDLNNDVRLCLVGDGEETNAYVQMLFRITAEQDLTDDVLFSGKVDQSELLAYYRAADLFVSMSEHEGFGVPLIEAMWFDIPVIALESTAVPETLGEAGILVTKKDKLMEIAALCNVVLSDGDLRGKMIRAGRWQREKFTARSLRPVYDRRLLSLFT